MKVNIEKIENPINIVRKDKLKKINGIKIQESISFSYSCKYEDEDEDVRHFHIFCLSIAMELVKDSIAPTEIGNIHYLKIPDHKNVLSELHKISSYIQNDKKCYPDKYKNKSNK